MTETKTRIVFGYEDYKYIHIYSQFYMDFLLTDFTIPLYNPVDELINLDLCYEEYQKNHQLEVVWDSDTDSETTLKDKETQTDPTVEFLLGQLILQTCPQKELVETYVKRSVKHVNTSTELLQALATGTQQARQTCSKPSRSDA